jgi:hypothetical protein
MVKMGLNFGLESSGQFCKRKFRWLMKIEGISSDGVNALPPTRSARPQLSFKEMEIRHVTENIYYPQKPEWRPVQLTLYDLQKNGQHPIFDWLTKCYDSRSGVWTPVASSTFIKQARLEMYNGCGEIVESWIFEEAWPQAVDFGELDMNNSEIVTCDLTLRYARAYIQ